MRFEISYPGGTTHEVDLPGGVCVVGRDPSCDIVLNDSKCSRRHAIVEDGPAGMSIRDAGSANGIYVNGRKVERAALSAGDRIKLGEVQLRLLAEIGETVVVAPDDLELSTGSHPAAVQEPAPQARAAPLPPASPPVSVAPAPQARPQPRPAVRPANPAAPPSAAPRARQASRPAPRPLRPPTVTLLAVLWALFVPVSVAGALVAAARLETGWPGWLVASLVAAAGAGLGTSMALGLRALASWARHLQIAAAAVGLLACPFTLAAATVLFYMTRPEVKAVFEDATPSPSAPADSAEPTFALSLVALLLVGLSATAVAALLL
jgi:hypothetical protein